MSVKVMGAIWELDLSAAKRLVLLAMADHAQHDGTKVFPSIGLIAWKTGYSERQIKRVIGELVDEKLLVMEKKASRHSPTQYRIDVSAGKSKPPYKSRRGDKMAPLTDGLRGDKNETRGDNLTPPRGDISVARGDIAVSPESSSSESSTIDDPSRNLAQAHVGDVGAKQQEILATLTGKMSALTSAGAGTAPASAEVKTPPPSVPPVSPTPAVVPACAISVVTLQPRWSDWAEGHRTIEGRHDKAWFMALNQLGVQLNRSTFNTWLKSLKLVEAHDLQWVIGTPDLYVMDWNHKHLLGAYRETLARFLRTEYPRDPLAKLSLKDRLKPEQIAIAFEVVGQTARGA